jgi:hypothetical protein
MRSHSMLRLVRRLFLAAIVLAAGCGGGPSDSEQVHATVEAFGRATAAKDYQRLCDELLAPNLIQKLESVGLPCEVALKQGLGDVQAPTLTIGKIDVDGDAASAQVNSTAQGQPPSHDLLKLQRVSGKWRIASLADEQ